VVELSCEDNSIKHSLIAFMDDVVVEGEDTEILAPDLVGKWLRPVLDALELLAQL